MKRLITRFVLWLAEKYGYWPPHRVIASAKVLCAAQELVEGSGEYKRHQVYAKLIKEYPTISKRTLGLAIELALST